MQYSVALLALAASASATAVTSLISPPGSNPSGSSNTYNGEFEITVQNVSDATLQNYAPATNCGKTGVLTLLLNNGQLKDSTGRFGYIASNYQFQFDPPPGPQAGAIFTDGFSIFSNGSLAIGPNATFYECFSGKFYNLYSQSIGGQCTPVFVDIIPCAGSATGVSSGSAPATAVSELSDGQPQVVTAPPVSEYTDGQPQVVTVAPVSEYSDGQPQVVQPTVVSEYSDGQPQVPTQIIAGGANSVVAQGVLALVGFLAVAIF